MSEHNRPTVVVGEMYDALVTPPPPGARVKALNRDGVLVFTQVGTDFHKYFDAWEPYLKIPESVKRRQVERYTNREDVCLVQTT